MVAVGRISRITSALTLDSRHHAGCHVVEVMTVKRPSTWIVRVESDCQFALGRQPDGVATRARKAPAIDGHNLEAVAVQVHGMAQTALIAQGQFTPLAGQMGKAQWQER